MAKKVTKKQRKLMRRTSGKVSAAVQYSLDSGTPAGNGYVGANPVFRPILVEGIHLGQYRKVREGIPFVSVERWV